MKKLFVDTNVVIDLLARREPFHEEANVLFSMADKKEVAIAVSSLTIANTSYTLSKQLKPINAKSVLRKLKLLIKILPLDEKVIDLALNDDTFDDFEVALQYFTAAEYNQEVIITRNVKDFKNARIPIMTPDQFLKSL
jgi:predicted nucleic acid-binding protein